MQCVVYGKHSVNDITVGVDSKLPKPSMKKDEGINSTVCNSPLDSWANKLAREP